MLRLLSSAVTILLLAFIARAVQLEVTITVTKLNKDGFVEFKAESDEKGEKATGRLTVPTKYVYRWNMGSAKQNIWYWWDTLDGEADLTIIVIGKPNIPVTLFKAHCRHTGKGEVQVGKTLAVPVSKLIPGVNNYRRNSGLPPYIVENKEGAITHIKECDEPKPVLKLSGKVGNEWDLILEGMIFERPADYTAFLFLENFKFR